nr:hypothetical protein [Tanacetum cinerariifolium]
MTSITPQQTKLDLELVPKENRLDIRKYNGRIPCGLQPKEETFQVVLDVLALTPCYPAFVITADVPKVYMHQFWNSVYKHHDFYRFKIDKKKRFKLTLDVFKDIFEICPRIEGQDFDALPSEEDIVSFLRELGHNGVINSLNDVVIDQMHQPWRTFAAIINRSLSRKTNPLDKLRLSRAQILWGMYYQKNVDYVELLWEDFIYQIDNYKTLSWRNKIRMHTLNDDYLINTLQFVSRKEASQKYGAVLPKCLTSPQMKESKAYKTYLSYATGTIPPKVVRKFKKAEPHVETQSKRKEKVDVACGKGIDLLSEVALTEEAHMKEVRKKSLRDFHKSHPSGSGSGNDDDDSNDEEGSERENDSEEQELDSEQDTNRSKSNSKSDKKDDDDDEVKDDDEEKYDDDDKSEGNEDRGMDNDDVQDKKADVRMMDAQQEKENLEITQEQVVEDAHVTITKKTEVPITSSSHSSDLAFKFLNFLDIPSADAEIVSPLDVYVHHEVLRISTSTFLAVSVSVIPEASPVYMNIPQSSQTFTSLCTNVVNAPREPFIVKQDHDVNPSHIDKCCCECGEALDEIIYQRCACPHKNFQCQPLNYYEPNSTYDSNYSVFDQFGDLHPQQDLCCDNCEGPYETSQCQPMNQNFYNSNSSGFNQTQPPQFPVVHPPPHEISIEVSHDQENQNKPEDVQELFRKLLDDFQTIHEELAEFINSSSWNRPAVYDDDVDDVDYTIVITPVLSTEEPDNSLSMGDEHLDTIPATESDEVKKSSVKDLIPIPSESEGIPNIMCDVHNPTPLEAKVHFEIVINFNNDYSSSDDDSLYYENIEYVEASPHDSELVSLEVEKIVIPEEEDIENDNLHEKLLKVNLLIAEIEALRDNTTPSSEFLTKSSTTSPIPFLEGTNTFHNSLPEFENFCFDLEEISSGSTTTQSDISLPDYDSFIFDLSNDQFPPTDRSDFTHEEFGDEPAHIISPPEYDCFYFRNLPDTSELISSLNSRIRENLSSTTCVNLPVEDDYSPFWRMKFNRYSFFETPKVLLLAWDRVSKIKDAFDNKQNKPEDVQELFRKLLDDLQTIHEELAEFINSSSWNRPAVYDDDDDDVDYIIAITPVLSTEEPDNSLSIPDIMCDVHNPTPLEAKDHFEIVINSNNDYSSSDDDSLYYENIEYVEASPQDSELVSLEVEKIVIPEEEDIENDNLREKLLKVNLLIAEIEALRDNPTPSSEFLTKSSSTSPIPFLEGTNTFHNSLPEFENFCFDSEEISSGSTTTHSVISLPEYGAFSFYDDHIEEISSGSTTTHSVISLPESDFTHEEFNDEPAHIISPPEYDCFYFRNLPNTGELISSLNSRIRENLSSTTCVNLPVEDDYSPLLAYVVWIFLAYLTYPVIPPHLYLFRNEDTIFDPGITINRSYSFKPGLSHRSGTFKKFNTHRSHLNESPMEMLFSTLFPMDQ